jgi:transposase
MSGALKSGERSCPAKSEATKAEAEQRLDAFLTAAEASGLPAFVSFAHGLRKWTTEFMAYFNQRATNGYPEGITNKIKVIKRPTYGLPTSLDSAIGYSYAAG